MVSKQRVIQRSVILTCERHCRRWPRNTSQSRPPETSHARILVVLWQWDIVLWTGLSAHRLLGFLECGDTEVNLNATAPRRMRDVRCTREQYRKSHCQKQDVALVKLTGKNHEPHNSQPDNSDSDSSSSQVAQENEFWVGSSEWR